MPSNNYIYKMSNAGGMSTITRYTDMLAGNTVWNPFEPVGAYESLSAITVPSGGSSAIVFNSIPSIYKHLQIRFISRSSGGAYNPFIQFNGDTSANYAWHYLDGPGSTVTSGGAGNQTNILMAGISGNANIFAAGIIDILDYANTNKNKTVKFLLGTDLNGSGAVDLWSGLWNSTAAINSITMNFSSAEFSNYAIYGIKG